MPSAWQVSFRIRLETTVPQLLDAGLSEEQAASVVHINEALGQALSGLVLDITFARVACEGGTHREGRPHSTAVANTKATPIDSSSTQRRRSSNLHLLAIGRDLHVPSQRLRHGVAQLRRRRRLAVHQECLLRRSA